MSSKTGRATDSPETDGIPELEDVVATPAETPPPNFDLFADSGLDREALRDALADRLADELDAALNELRAEFEESLRKRVEARLRDRLPEIVDAVLTGQPRAPE